jgi:hypothetical protein
MKLIATNSILYKNMQYQKGDALPLDTEMQEAWIMCGSAAFKEEDDVKTIPVKARRVTAQSGLAGTAVNSESEINLIGRVPETERRRKK